MGIDWYRAARYCNWVSQQKDIPEEQWCYEINGDNVKLKSRYLSLSGYRLPSEAEMEYATRAGALTSRFFGETDKLLNKYAWFNKNSEEKTWPVGSLKPNDFGFFDVQGNAYTSCQESYQPYRLDEQLRLDTEDELMIDSNQGRILRGGSFLHQATLLRSANRFNIVPTLRINDVSFRTARTLTPGTFDDLPRDP